VRVRIQCTAVCALTLTGTHQDDELASEDGRTTTATERARPPDGWQPTVRFRLRRDLCLKTRQRLKIWLPSIPSVFRKIG
jgi:hypothetical protein